MGGPAFNSETGTRAVKTRWQREERGREAERREHEQFMRDLRGDHDGPHSYFYLPPADSTPSAAEIESEMS